MGQRVRTRDVMQLTGLSRATVDRVINRRGGTHPATERSVLEAIDRLTGKFPNGALTDTKVRKAETTVDALLRLDPGLTETVFAIAREQDLPVSIQSLDGKNEDEIFDAVRQACQTDQPLIVTVKNHEPLVEELVHARRRGKRVIAAFSDLAPEARDAYVGIDNRRAGQTGAYLIGNSIRKPQPKVAVVLGDLAFRCHEDREIGFRSGLRTLFSDAEVVEVAKGDDSTEKTREAVRVLLEAHPDLDGIYNVSGANDGLVEAVAEKGLTDRITVVCHETNSITVPLLRRGLLHFLIAQEAASLLKPALELALQGGINPGKPRKLTDFHIYTPFNLPFG